MNVNIQIPDEAMSLMLSTGRRLQGSISLASPEEGNFHPFRHRTGSTDTNRTVMMLRCGKALVSNQRLHLHLNVERNGVTYANAAIQDDLREASEFFDEYDE